MKLKNFGWLLLIFSSTVYLNAQCDDPDPQIVTNCYNYSGAGAAESIVDFPSVSSGDVFGSSTNVDNPFHGNVSADSQTGSLLGAAFDPYNCVVFFAAYQKRHTIFGNLGMGGIYAVDYCNTQTTADWLDVATLVPSIGVDPKGQPDDCDSWATVGTTGLGDLDYNHTNSSLYVVNMGAGTLVEIAIDPTDPYNTIPTSANEITIPAISDATLCDPTDGTMRPMGLGIDANGVVYVGMVCDAALSNDLADLNGYIYSYDPSTTNWSASAEVTIPFNYNKGMLNCCGQTAIADDCGGTGNAGCCVADDFWRTWAMDYPAEYTGGGAFAPQPMISDIEFDSNGNMAIGVRDRHGDQTGAQTPLPDCDPATVGTDEVSHTAGDLLYACFDGTSYTLENNGSCNAVVGANPASGQGIGGGEFFLDNHWNHGEISLGMLTYLPQTDQFAVAVYDPLSDCAAGAGQFWDQGIIYFGAATGNPERAYRLVNSEAVAGFPAKGNGIGDLLVICPIPCPQVNCAEITIGQ